MHFKFKLNITVVSLCHHVYNLLSYISLSFKGNIIETQILNILLPLRVIFMHLKFKTNVTLVIWCINFFYFIT
jgi:hypothetical protein